VMNPEELTLGELRRVLALGANDQTISEALEAAREDDEVAARHEQATAGYHGYVEARRERLRAREVEAMAECDLEQQRTGRPWPSDEDRAKSRRAAGLAARDRFEIDEPLLEFQQWVEAGSPDHFEAKTPAARRLARIDQLVRGGCEHDAEQLASPAAACEADPVCCVGLEEASPPAEAAEEVMPLATVCPSCSTPVVVAALVASVMRTGLGARALPAVTTASIGGCGASRSLSIRTAPTAVRPLTSAPITSCRSLEAD
jgi:hypothetical protein